jgi:hypothetical protein
LTRFDEFEDGEEIFDGGGEDGMQPGGMGFLYTFWSCSGGFQPFGIVMLKIIMFGNVLILFSWLRLQ